MQGFSYFPAIVYRDERPDLVQKVLPLCNQYLDQVRQPNVWMTQSAPLHGEVEAKDVANYLLDSAVSVLASQGYAVDKYEFGVWMWAQEVIAGGTDVHVHKNSQICGWFFLETPEGGAFPAYYDPRMNKEIIELDYDQQNEITNATGTVFFNNIAPGTVLFNNSWMRHQLVSGLLKVPTKCIHFIVSHREK